MRESRTFGSVGGEGGNILAYPASPSYRDPRRVLTKRELTRTLHSRNFFVEGRLNEGVSSVRLRARASQKGTSGQSGRVSNFVQIILN
jgi:hypothetical protein